MIFCSNCGYKLEDRNAKFCTDCGHNLDSLQYSTENPHDSHAASVESSEITKSIKKHKKTLLIIVGMFITIAILIWGLNGNALQNEIQIHGIKIGDSVDDVVKKLGIPKEKEVNATENYTLYEYEKVEFLFFDGKVVAISTQDEEFETRHGIKIGGIVDNIIEEYNGFDTYVDYKVVLVKKSNTLLIFNIQSTFDDGPMRVGTITAVDTSNINTDTQSIEDLYISTKTRVNASIAPLLEDGFIKLEKENIRDILAVIEGRTR